MMQLSAGRELSITVADIIAVEALEQYNFSSYSNDQVQEAH
jgi:hypothetical protein